MSTKAFIAAILVVALTGMFAGCSQSQLTTTLTALSDATSAGAALLTILGASGVIPPVLAAIAATALTGVANAIPEIQGELESSDPLATQIAKCVGFLTPVIVADIPGIPAQFAGLINGINGLIQSLIAQLNGLLPAASAMTAVHPTAVQPARLVMSYGDRRAIAAAVKKSAATVATLKAIK